MMNNDKSKPNPGKPMPSRYSNGNTNKRNESFSIPNNNNKKGNTKPPKTK